MARFDAKNLKFKIQGKMVLFRANLTRTIGPSTTGKTELISTSRGTIRIAEDIYAVVTIFRKLKTESDEGTQTDEQEKSDGQQGD
jgi:hypothetical protein